MSLTRSVSEEFLFSAVIDYLFSLAYASGWCSEFLLASERLVACLTAFIHILEFLACDFQVGVRF
jgi:hypothetical protein